MWAPLFSFISALLALKPDPPQITRNIPNTHTHTHIHPHTQRHAGTNTHIPEPVCEILRLIEEEECDLVTPGCGEGCYKCVCVCVCVSVSVCVFDVREQVIVCTLSIGLLFPEVSSPIFQFSSNGLNRAACSVDAHTHTHRHIHKHNDELVMELGM